MNGSFSAKAALGAAALLIFGASVAAIGAKPASASEISRGALSQGVRYMGGINTSAHRYFTVTMKKGATAADAALVANYFRSFGLTMNVSDDHRFLTGEGSYVQSGAAAHVGFQRVIMMGDEFVTSDRAPSFPASV